MNLNVSIHNDTVVRQISTQHVAFKTLQNFLAVKLERAIPGVAN